MESSGFEDIPIICRNEQNMHYSKICNLILRHSNCAPLKYFNQVDKRNYIPESHVIIEQVEWISGFPLGANSNEDTM